jgi:heme oxygenase
MAADSSLGVGEGLRELNPAGAVPTLSLLLRTETAGHHRRAEGADFQRLLFAGKIPLTGYQRWLEQLLLVHRGLEARLWRAWEPGAWRELTASDRRRSVQLEADLLALQTGVLSEPASATETFLKQIAGWSGEPPAELLGALYVLEGSSNGARMMAPGIRAAYRFTGISGTQNLDPYGENQSVRWQAFRAALDEALPESAWPAALEGARVCFEAITKIGDELQREAQASSPVRE